MFGWQAACPSAILLSVVVFEREWDMCIVKGCGNEKEQGEMEGALCLPCAEQLKRGKFTSGTSFVLDLQNECKKYKQRQARWDLFFLNIK